MIYENIVEGVFVSRPNRFIAYVNVEGVENVCHVKNTGRCKEILVPGKSKVYLVDHGTSGNRKTRYSLVAVEKNGFIINMDSQAPNTVAAEWLIEGGLYEDITYIRREKTYKASRFDIYYERPGIKGFVEVKGVTLEKDGIAMFPDAPTERGLKHIYELIEARRDGYEANILFVIQMKDVKYFTPNYETHKEFGEALKVAQQAGVNIYAVNCEVYAEGFSILDYVSVKL